MIDEAHFKSSQQQKHFHYLITNKPGPIFGLAQRSWRCSISVFDALVGNTQGPLYFVNGNFNRQYKAALGTHK